jgi:hypothetical protein
VQGTARKIPLGVAAAHLRNGQGHDRGGPWTGDGWPAWAALLLRDLGMPRDEIHTVVATDDPELVRRYLELHGERLEERLAADLRTLGWIERSMTTTAISGGRAMSSEPRSRPYGLGGSMTSTSGEVMPKERPATRSQPDTWVIVCEHLHGAVGPIPTEQLAMNLAAHASEIGACTYLPVRLALAQGRAREDRSE